MPRHRVSWRGWGHKPPRRNPPPERCVHGELVDTCPRSLDSRGGSSEVCAPQILEGPGWGEHLLPSAGPLAAALGWIPHFLPIPHALLGLTSEVICLVAKSASQALPLGNPHQDTTATGDRVIKGKEASPVTQVPGRAFAFADSI